MKQKKALLFNLLHRFRLRSLSHARALMAHRRRTNRRVGQLP